MMIGAAITISIGFGIAFSTLYVVHSRTEHMSRVSRKSLQGLAAINHLNFELKALSSQKKNALELREDLHRGIQTCDEVLQGVTAPTTPLASDLESRRSQIRNLWQNLADELRKARVYLDNASELKDHQEIILYGVDIFLDRYDHTKSGAIGNAQLFAELRDFKKQIAVIEHTADLFLKQFQLFSDEIDERHGDFLRTSQLISLGIFAVVTIFTIVFFTIFSGALTRKLQNMVREIREQNRELSERDEELRAIMAAVPDLMFVLDAEGRYQDIFAANPDLLIASKENLVGKTIHEAIPEKAAQTAQAKIDKAVETQRIQDCEYELTIDGRLYCFAARLVPFVHQSAPAVLCLSRDITDQKKAEHERSEMEKKMRHAQKMEAVGQLAGGVAHDFNNMLAGIIGAAELLQHRMSGDVQAGEYISMIQRSVQRAADLAQKLLVFSRRQEPGATPIDLHKTLRDAMALLEKTVDKRVHIELELSAQDCTITGDSTQFFNAFLNLGINASHAMPKGGTVSFSTQSKELSEDDCTASIFDLLPGQYIQITVQDTGCGIADEDLPRIFDPFFTTKKSGKGTGLGLAATYGTVCQHGGSITVDSDVDQGTRFRLLLPLTTTPAKIEASETEMIHGKGCILLVEDEETLRTIGERSLKKLGYRVLSAENGQVALDIFRETGSSIDLVILDMIMPEMNGRDCFDALRSIRPDLKVLVASGFAENEDLAYLRSEGISGFVKKPFKGVELSRRVAEILAADFQRCP